MTAITAGISLNEFEFPPHSGTNVGFDDGSPITITFPSGASAFGGYFTYRTSLHLTGFDAANNPVVNATSTFNNNLALSGDTGSSPNELLSLNFAGGLSKIVITGAAVGRSFTLDDLSFTPLGTAPPAIVQFSQASYTFSEATTSAQLIVTRTGNTSGTSTIFYATVDNPAAVRCDDTMALPGVAFSRCDYATSLDTITFNPGDVQQTISIPLIDDAHVEPDETFQVVLSNPGIGTNVGTPATATVTITDNDTAQTPNPIVNNSFFVRQQYLDFLAREPDTPGFNGWLNILNGCPDVNNLDPSAPSAQCDRIIVSLSFFGSQEFHLKGFFVFRFYRVAFDRIPQYTEIVTDMRSVTGRTPAEVFTKKATFATAFTQRPEFTTAYGTMTHADYVSTLLGRYNLTQIITPDPQQPDGTNKVTLTQADLTNALNANTLTRAQVLRAIADSDQVFTLEFNRAFVGLQYYVYLRRTPEPAGYNAWLTFLNAHPTDFRAIDNGFINSQEYKLRFGPVQ
ncbi:MAG: Calx-beta domain-containing protein [Pyrinomonadaceae bacterium]